MAVYLAFPIITTTALASLWRHVSKTTIVAFATTASATLFTFLYCLAWGVHSTIGIGYMFALFVFALFSVATVLAVRAIQSLSLRQPPGTFE